MTQNAITLTDTNVNSGTAVEFTGSTTISYDINSTGMVYVIPGQDATAAYTTRLGKFRFTGFGNPVITITGSYDRMNTDTNEGTLTLLKGFVTSDATKTLTDDLLGTIYCNNAQLHVDRSGEESDAGYIVNWTLTLTEVYNE